MLKWLDNYYIGKEIKKPEKIRGKIDSGKPAAGVYLITLSENPGNILEILPAVTLVQKAAYAVCPMIVGMTKGKDNAIELVKDILEEVYGKTGAFQVEEYLKNR